MSGTQIHSNDIIVDYYPGAYGLTIRIGTNHVSSAQQIRNIFLHLAQSQNAEVEFQKVVPVRKTNIASLLLKRVPIGKEQMRKLEHVQTIADGPVFVWTRDSDGWMECAEKLDWILRKGNPGHQYLTVEGVDDALIEFAFREIE
jgi:hypothetical protein